MFKVLSCLISILGLICVSISLFSPFSCVPIFDKIVSIFALTTVSAVLEYGLGFDFYKIMVLFLLFIVTMIIIYKLFHNLIWWFPEIKNYLMPEVDHQEQDFSVLYSLL